MSGRPRLISLQINKFINIILIYIYIYIYIIQPIKRLIMSVTPTVFVSILKKCMTVFVEMDFRETDLSAKI